ncbi:MAG: PQQ-dependent sugar dehydrogenase [Verrucomicrobiota bacterium]
MKPALSVSLFRHLPCLALVTALSPLLAQDTAAPAPAKKDEKPPIVSVPVDYELVNAFPGIKFEQPLGVVSVPGDKKRLFIVEKTGRVQVITGLDTGKLEKKLFLDLTQIPKATLVTEGECGVLGLAFPPDHAKSSRVFVYYSLKIGGVLHQRVSRFHVFPNDPNRVDNSTEQTLITQKDEASNHNGGDLAFGPDGYLYITAGDGGAGNDKFDNARFISKGFHGAIFRIDVDKKAGNLAPHPHPAISLAADGAAFYAVPKDNPFVGSDSHHGEKIDPKAVRTEIWATGLRNPWRIWFDTIKNRLFCGDVGQNMYEEIDLITKGGDYGWPHREALHPFIQGPTGDKEPTKDFKPLDPIFEYPRTTGLSVTGGVVYRADKFPQFKDKYIFADYAFGRVIALKDAGKSQWSDETIAQEVGIAGIGIDPRDDEVLFANLALGEVKHLQSKAKKATSSN